jgi:hypothetical protein
VVSLEFTPHFGLGRWPGVKIPTKLDSELKVRILGADQGGVGIFMDCWWEAEVLKRIATGMKIYKTVHSFFGVTRD